MATAPSGRPKWFVMSSYLFWLMPLPAAPVSHKDAEDRSAFHTGIPAYPFCHVTLRGRNPREGYPEEPGTVGEHLKKRRLDLKLLQRQDRIDMFSSLVSGWRRRATVASRAIGEEGSRPHG
jgi:hypothetical protein